MLSFEDIFSVFDAHMFGRVMRVLFLCACFLYIRVVQQKLKYVPTLPCQLVEIALNMEIQCGGDGNRVLT